MPITDGQARDWAWEESKHKSAHHSFFDDRTRDFQMFVTIATRPSIIDGLKPARRDQLIWNMGRLFFETSRSDQYDELRIALASGVPDFFKSQFLKLAEHNIPLEMFWDDVCSGVANADRPLVDAIFSALERQLAIPNVWCQASAIHGFNHLKEPRCRPLLRRFIEDCDNESLRAYARRAMTFTLM